MSLDDAFGDAKSEACPLDQTSWAGVCLGKLFKHFRLELFWDSKAKVFYGGFDNIILDLY